MGAESREQDCIMRETGCHGQVSVQQPTMVELSAHSRFLVSPRCPPDTAAQPQGMLRRFPWHGAEQGLLTRACCRGSMGLYA